VQAEGQTLRERALVFARAEACRTDLARALGDPDQTAEAEEALAAARADLQRLDERLGLLVQRIGPARDKAQRALDAQVGAVRAALRAEALARQVAAEAALVEALRPLAGAVAVAAAAVWAAGGKGSLDLQQAQLPAELVAPRQVRPTPPPAAAPGYGYREDEAAQRLAALNPPPYGRKVEYAGGVSALPDKVLFGRTGR
jgi:hypothetical protein